MKKKIIFTICCLFSIFYCDNVGAVATQEACNEQGATLNLMDFVVSDKIAKLFKHSNTFFQMTLNGEPAMCIQENVPANSGLIYKPTGETVPAGSQQAKALEYRIAHPGDLDAYLIAQAAAWNKLDWKFLKDMYLFEGYPDLTAGIKATETLNEFNNTPTSGTYYIWSAPGKQSMITKLKGCEPPSPSTCPKGKMNLSGEIGGCDSTSKGGKKYTFSYTPSSGDSDNVHWLYGEQIKGENLGEYCKLFCTEWGTATLPGALGDTQELGHYIIWPTSGSNYTDIFAKDYYPIKFTGYKRCTLSVMPDENMPGTNGECENNPIKDYGYYYGETNTLHDKTDHHGYTYEKVRIRNNKIDNEPSYCDTYYDTYYNKEYINAKADYNAKKAAADAVNPKKTTCYHNYTGQPYECDTDAYKNAIKAMEKAAKVVQKIEESINTCKNYISYYNTTREIAQMMAICANYDPRNNCSGSSCAIYNFQTSVSFNFNDAEYAATGVIPENSASYYCSDVSGSGCEGTDMKGANSHGEKKDEDFAYFNNLYLPKEFENEVTDIRQRQFAIKLQSEIKYTLSTDFSYVDLNKNKFVKSTEIEGLANYKPIMYRGNLLDVVPTSFNNVMGKDYELTLSNISFGEGGKFTKAEYACPVKFAKGGDEPCICPGNSEQAGKSLTCYLSKYNVNSTIITTTDDEGKVINVPTGMKCAEAKEKYCNSTTFEFFDIEDAVCNYYCPAPYEQYEITSCVVDHGYSYEYCVQKDPRCNGTTDEDLKCPNTRNATYDMDQAFKDCVILKMLQGYSKSEAMQVCDLAECIGDSSGRIIIYRTIKLENPFPGKTISNIVSGFNNDVKGRFPGTNWNSKVLVYNKIRNNRSGYSVSDDDSITNNGTGSSIYQTKEPLYTFVLNGNTINKIRDYNDKQSAGYSDFTLNCKKDNAAACVSHNFVHNATYGLVSGTCSNCTSKNCFYTCDN